MNYLPSSLRFQKYKSSTDNLATVKSLQTDIAVMQDQLKDVKSKSHITISNPEILKKPILEN
jgi:hypothetical protein